MAAGRCPHCNLALTEVEAHTETCPFCKSSLNTPPRSVSPLLFAALVVPVAAALGVWLAWPLLFPRDGSAGPLAIPQPAQGWEVLPPPHPAPQPQGPPTPTPVRPETPPPAIGGGAELLGPPHPPEGVASPEQLPPPRPR